MKISTLLLLLILSPCFGAQPSMAEPLELKNIIDSISLGIPTQDSLSPSTPNTSISPLGTTESQKIVYGVLIKGTEKEKEVFQVLTVRIGEVLSPFALDRNKKDIRSLGIFSSVAISTTPSQDGIQINIEVIENPIVDSIIFKGLTLFSEAKLLSLLHTKQGRTLNLNSIRKDIGILEAVYKDNGYILAKVLRVDTPQKTGDSLVYHVLEGTIHSIIPTGNERTRDYVILREMDLTPHVPLNAKTLKRDLQKIYNLNYFTKVEPEFIPMEEEGQHKLLVRVEEKNMGSINFGGGYGQRSGLFIYSDLNLDNIFGTGQMVGLKGQWGRASSYQFKYHNPWMWDKRKSFTFRYWHTRGLIGFNSLGTNDGFRQEQRTGSSVTLGFPFSYELGTSHRFKVEKVSVPQESTLPEKNYSIFSYRFGISHDTRDIRFNPLQGHYHYLFIERGLKVKSSSLNFTKYDLAFNFFIKTFEKQTIATRFLFGMAKGDLDENEHYYVGGPNTVRGYEPFPNSFASGKEQFIINVEYRFLFTNFFNLILFTDWGWARSAGELHNGKMGKGIGVRIFSPLGPIRLDFGFNEDGEMRTHFNIGNVF